MPGEPLRPRLEQPGQLTELARQMRLGLEVQNRKVARRVYRSCFLGGEAVSWITSRGLARSRSEATAVGQRMMALGLIRSVEDAETFLDSYAFYQFVWDKEGPPEVCLQPPASREERDLEPLARTARRWAFPPHTAHNSLVLDAALADELEEALSGSDLAARGAALLKLRERVRQVAKPNAPGWVKRGETTAKGGGGGKVKMYSRSKPVGDFKTRKSVGTVAVSPRAFLLSFLDLETRRQWEPLFGEGVVVEAIEVPAELCEEGGEDDGDQQQPAVARYLLSTPRCLSNRSGGGSKGNLLGTPRTEGSPDSPCASGEEAGGRTAVGRFDDPGLQEVMRHLAQNQHELLQAWGQCCVCGRGGEEEEQQQLGLRMCACCGIVACRQCCSCHVYELGRGQLVEVCDHCFHFSSRIQRPSTADNQPGGLEVSAWRAGAQQSSEAAAAADVRWACCSSCGQRIVRTIDSLEDHDRRCPGRATSSDKQHRGIGGGKPGSSSLLMRRRGLGSPTPLTISSGGGQGLSSAAMAGESSTRILYRTARSPSSALVSPREVCVLQDTFCDEDGTVYVYELSVQHEDVEGSPGHVAAEVLFLGYVARAAGKATENAACSLTVISQVDTRSTVPSWMSGLVADGGRYGLYGGHDLQLPTETRGSSSSTGKLKGGEEDEEEAGQGSRTDSGESSASSTASATCPSALPPALSVQDFQPLSVIGRGGFGKVFLVRRKANGTVFAMKVLNKRDLRRRNQIERARTERKVMAGVDHPFIVRLQYAFHTSSRVYMVMDFMQGGDIFTLLRRIGRLPEEGVRVLVAEIALALQYLHDRDVVYRDLKPENILLGSDGHVKLTDFGLCRYFEIRPPPRSSSQPSTGPSSSGGQAAYRPPFVTHSFCGTEEYMAPEVLLNQGHGSAVDWWCLGLCMHEMAARRHPFKGASHIDTLRNICAMDPMLEPYLSSSAQQCIDRLLRKNPDERIRDLSMLQAQPFFLGRIDWDDVYHKRLPPPFVPSLRDVEDVSSFSSLYTGEAWARRRTATLDEHAPGKSDDDDDDDGAGGEAELLGWMRRPRRRREGGCFEFLPFKLVAGDGASLRVLRSEDDEDEEDQSFDGFTFTRQEMLDHHQQQGAEVSGRESPA